MSSTVAEASVEAALAGRIAAAGDTRDLEAEAAFYRRMAPRVRRYGYRHLRDGDAAADFMQQVLIFTLEQLRAGAVREPGRIVSYVFGVCRRMALDQHRLQQRRDELLERHGELLAVADIAVAPRLDHDRMADCLDRLAERERAVIVQTFYEECSAERVAASLGLSAGNVRVIRHRSLARLRDCMGLVA